MHDIKWIRGNPEAFDAAMARRGLPAKAAGLVQFDDERRAKITEAQEIKTRLKEISASIAAGKQKGEDASEATLALVFSEKVRLKDLEETIECYEESLRHMLAVLPNVLADHVPPGEDASANVVIDAGEPAREFAFTPKHHYELGPGFGMDFEAGVALAGTRFVVLSGKLARLERALVNMLLDLHTKNGFLEVSPPYLVNAAAVYGTGQLPKFANDLFRTQDGHYLIPTAEVPLTNLVAGKMLTPAALPLRFTAYTPCFRAEAGAAGRDNRGMIRMHQFGKVELVIIAAPSTTDRWNDQMQAAVIDTLRALELPYRAMLLCAGDTGFAARETIDYEVWFPGAQMFREISSISDCGDFQARRMNARVKDTGVEFLRTMNASALPLGRTIAALIENHQQENGSVRVPAALQPYYESDLL